MSLSSLLTVPSTKPHTATVIFLHGLGDSGHSWEPVGQMLSPHLPHVKWIFPHAPTKPVTLNGGYRMPAWYDILDLSPHSEEDESGMMHTLSFIKTLIQKEVDQGIAPDRIVLGGFSQGGAMSMLYSVTAQEKIGGFAVLSGYLPLAKSLERIYKDHNKASPTHLFHGMQDPVVQYDWGKKSADRLRDLGHSVEFTSYSHLGHSADPDEFKDLLSFLIKVIH